MLYEQLGGERPECDGSQDHDLFLRLIEQTGGAAHLPQVLYYWRVHAGSTSGGTDAQDSLTHRVHGVGGQHIVVVGEGKIFARRQRLGGVGVGGDALIFDLFVYDSLIFLLIFPYDTLHIGKTAENCGLPTISILTPLYNTPENYLREFLGSFVNQTAPNVKSASSL